MLAIPGHSYGIWQQLQRWWMLRRMGYFSNQMGVMHRYLKEQERWNQHLEKTQRTILETLIHRKPKTLAILGSGWLLGIPLQEILRLGIKVALIDIVHPPRVKSEFKGDGRIQFIDADITGSIVLAWNFGRQRGSVSYQNLLAALSKSNLTHALNSDLILSVNILSQLHVLTVDYLAGRGKIDGAQQNEMAATIQQAHLNALPAGRTLLITDVEEERYNDVNELVGVNPRVIAHFEGWEKGNGWQWRFDTKCMDSGDQQVVLNVASYWKA